MWVVKVIQCSENVENNRLNKTGFVNYQVLISNDIAKIIFKMEHNKFKEMLHQPGFLQAITFGGAKIFDVFSVKVLMII